MPNCCAAKTGVCTRSSDGKKFNVTKRKYTKKECTTKPIKGFTMRASCAPYKNCLKKK